MLGQENLVLEHLVQYQVHQLLGQNRRHPFH